jgi:SAM-dependent methyltransferase
MEADQVKVTSCPLCGFSSNQLFDQRVSYGELIVNRICKTCGFVFQSPHMSQEKLDQFYLRDYRQLYQGEAGPIQKDLVAQTLRATHLLDFARKNSVLHLERYLDIGSSAGKLLNSFQENYHCISVGIEPGQAYRESAQRTGLQVYPHLEDLPKAFENSFDLVSVVHVLEHFPNPVNTLRELHQKWLVPNGWLLVEVPNLYCHDSFELAHLASYSQHTLRQLINKAGFEIIALQAHGIPRSKVLTLYITLLARAQSEQEIPYMPAIKPESFVRFKRHWGLWKRRVIERMLPGRAWQNIQCG